MLEPRKKKRRPNKWAVVIPILLVLISSVLVFSGRVLSDETEAEKYIVFESYQWNMTENPSAEIEWLTKSKDISFIVNLEEDYQRILEGNPVTDPSEHTDSPTEPSTVTTIDPNADNPLKVTAKQGGVYITTSIKPYLKDGTFTGLYEVEIPETVDGEIEINVDIPTHPKWSNKPSNNNFKIIRDTTESIVSFKVNSSDALLPDELYKENVKVSVEIIENSLVEESLKVTVKKNDEAEVELEKPVTTDQQKYEGDYEFTENGEYILLVTSKDEAGNLLEKSLNFTISKDDNEPELFVLDLEDGGNQVDPFTNTKKIGVKVESLISIREAQVVIKNGEDIVYQESLESIGRKTKVLEFGIPKDDQGNYIAGNYQVVVTVFDKYSNGRTYTLTYSFVADYQDPKFTYSFENDKSYKLNEEEKMVVEVNVLEGNFLFSEYDVKVQKFDGKETKETSVPFRQENGYLKFEAIAEGEYTIEASAKDKAGNEISETKKFKIDKGSKPFILIKAGNLENEEINGQYFKEDTQIDFSVTDTTLNLLDTILTVKKGLDTYTDINPLTQLLFTGKTEHIFNKDGVYGVTFSSKDFFGENSSKGPITFTIDKTPPELSISGLKEEEEYGGRQDLNIKVLDKNFDIEQTKIKVIRDDEELKDYKPEVKLIEEDGKNGAVYGYSFIDNGNYEIQFDIKDRASNNPINDSSVKFSIDDEGPDVIVSGVENNKHYNSVVNLTVRLEDLTLDVPKGKPIIRVTQPDGLVTEYNNWSDIEKNGKIRTTQQWLSFTDEGDYKIEFLGQDLKENIITKKPVYFTIDKSSPQIKMGGIKDNSFIKDGSIDIEITEHNYDVTDINVYYLLNGSNKEHNLEWKDSGEKSYESYTFNKDGDYEFIIIVTDGAGNKTEKRKVFTVDNKKPIISITDVNRYSNKSIPVNIGVTERNFENNNVNITVTRKLEVNREPMNYPIGEWKNIKEITDLSHLFDRDGEYEITVEATDAAGNKGDTEKLHFTIDKTDPEVELETDIVNGNNYRKNMLVKMKAEDRNIDLSNTNLEVKKDGKAFNVGELKLLGDLKTTAFNSYTFFEEGNYVINLNTRDKAGNYKKHDQLSFIIDKTNPVVKIDGVNNNSFNPENKNVTISIDELNFKSNNVSITAMKDGSPFNIGNWDNSGKLSKLGYNFNRDGLYTILATAEDKAGNGPISERMIFTIDKTKPSIEITGVDNNAYYNVDKPVNATIKDVNLDINKITVTRNGARYNAGGFSVNGDLASFRHNFSGEGEYNILVEATDKAGNSFSKTMAFTIDKTKPVITPKFKGQNRVIKDGEYINEVFTPEFALDEAEDMIVSATLNNGANLGKNIPVAAREMSYTYKVLARDKAGNESTLEISFTLDTTKPMLNISGVLDGFFNKDIAPKVTYSDIHLDRSKTSVTLNGKPFENGAKLEYEQDYILKAVITDLAKNVSSRTIVFTIDKTKPVIKFKEPISNNYFNTDLLPQLLIEDMSAYDIIAMMLDGKPYEAGDPIKEEGKHVMFFEVKDKAGNIQQLSVEFIIDKTAPKVVYEGVKNKEKYYDPVDISIRLDNPNDKLKSVMINGELFDGDVIEENGYKVIKTTLAEIKPYEINVTAYDEAGNEKTTVIAFEIVEKGALVKFYENKPLLGGTIAGLVGLLGAAATMLVRRRKGKVEEE
jgi:large repetitive protein